MKIIENKFLLFDENKNNMLSAEAYNASSQRKNGVSSGIASSQLHNKQAHQVSSMVWALGEMLVKNGYNASDVSMELLSQAVQGSLVGKVSDKATTEETVAGISDDKYVTPKSVKNAILGIREDVLPISLGGTGGAQQTMQYIA